MVDTFVSRPGERKVRGTKVRRAPWFVPTDGIPDAKGKIVGRGNWRMLPADTTHNSTVTRPEGEAVIETNVYEAKGFVHLRNTTAEQQATMSRAFLEDCIRRGYGSMVLAEVRERIQGNG